MKSLRIVLFLSLSMLFMGCPYQGDFMLGAKSDKPIDKRILGKWNATAWDAVQNLEFLDAGNNEFFLKVTAINSEDTEHKTTFYRVFVSKFIGKEFLNVQTANSKGEVVSERFYYFTWTFQGDNLVTKCLVNPGMEETESWTTDISDKKSFEKAVKKNIENEAVYGEEVFWRRY